MSFPWLDCTPPRNDGPARRVKVAIDELAHRAALFFRLGFTEKAAADRLRASIAWEFDSTSKSSKDKRPDGLSDAAIGKIVSDTYARRPA